MNSVLGVRGTALLIEKRNVEKLLSILTERTNYEENQNNITIYNHKNYFIYEDDFIEYSMDFNDIIKRYTSKKYEENKRYIPGTGYVEVVEDEDKKDVRAYSEFVSNNNITGKKTIGISINVLKNIFTSEKGKTILNIFILFALGNKLKCESEKIYVEFNNGDKSYGFDIAIDENMDYELYAIYNWIFNEDKFNHSLSTKVDIVRGIVVNRQSIKEVDSILDHSKMIYSRIISGKTSEYFDQVNKLKDDFLELSKNELSAERFVNITYYTWLVGAFIFMVDKYNDLSQSLSGIVIGVGFILTLWLIYYGYKHEISKLEKVYEQLEVMYDKQLYLDKGIFKSTIKKPTVGKSQTVIFVISLISLLIILIYYLLQRFIPVEVLVEYILKK